MIIEFVYYARIGERKAYSRLRSCQVLILGLAGGTCSMAEERLRYPTEVQPPPAIACVLVGRHSLLLARIGGFSPSFQPLDHPRISQTSSSRKHICRHSADAVWSSKHLLSLCKPLDWHKASASPPRPNFLVAVFSLPLCDRQ